jgi:hypothetical protein
MNAFDGALTIMGVVIGAHFSGVIDAHIVITAGIAQQRGHGHLRHQRCLSGREGGEEERLKEAGDVMPYFFCAPDQYAIGLLYFTCAETVDSIHPGVFLARISDERPMASGIQMILVGIATIIIVCLVAQ